MCKARARSAPALDLDPSRLVRKPAPLAVRLPDLATVPDPWRGATYVVRSLLGSGDHNPKLARSNRAGSGYMTWGLSLAPATESGHQLCSSSTPGCRAACLYRQGHGRLDPGIAAARIARAIAWKEHRAWFQAMLRWELGRLTRKAWLEDFRIAVRMNVVSDVQWEREWPALLAEFDGVEFYDYSKHVRRMARFLDGNFPPNYHLTFSMSEDAELDAHTVLARGGNVAIVFRGHLPTHWHGVPVIDGDETDLRFLDPAGVVVGLLAKGSAKWDATGFVADPLGTPARRLKLVVC